MSNAIPHHASRAAMAWFDPFLAYGACPDWMIRAYVRYLCKKRINREPPQSERGPAIKSFVQALSGQPVALSPDASNRQHYEVPTTFFQKVLGKHMKYSCCLWDLEKHTDQQTLDAAEEAMLKKTCQNACITNGIQILELGCGWGALTLYMAQAFPGSQITAISYSRTQKAYIDAQAVERRLSNIRVITADINELTLQKFPEMRGRFDRIVSVEMFEHVRNYPRFLKRISTLMKPEGKLFVHIFAYKGMPYLYDAEDPNDWMARNFFAGGTMPGDEMLEVVTTDLELCGKWKFNGRHYQTTLETWLRKMDSGKSQIYPVFRNVYGNHASKFWNHWRVFFIACAEVFGYDKGRRWFVLHYVFCKKRQ